MGIISKKSDLKSKYGEPVSASGTPLIRIQQLSKHFDDQIALHDISLDIHHGEFLTLLGPSGCGKTTLLRIIAGFEQPETGSIWLQDQNITKLPPEKRHINMVFQNYALFPHMKVFDNVAFGLRCQKIPEDEIKARVENALDMVRLNQYHHRLPSQLSGGQQQRVAIARAVVNRPKVLLLDEPLSALDYKLRKSMRVELKQLQRELGITFIFVTHDQEEALAMSDRIAVINNGTIEQLDSARKVYEQPTSLFTAQFIGEANIFTTHVLKANEKTLTAEIENKIFSFGNTIDARMNDQIYVIIRPEDIHVWDNKEAKDRSNMLPGVIEEVIYKGSTIDLSIRLDSHHLISATEFFNEDDPNLFYEINEKVWVEWMHGWEVVLPYATSSL